LKNSTSFIHQQPSSPEKVDISSPPLGADPAENKDITLQNTLQNAGRRSSSAARRTSTGRRLSGTPSAFGNQEDERSPHLKWDEANLYLAEQEKSSKMKIDEPKTPWAPSYDPSQDEMELEAQNHTLDANDLVVDELDQARHKKVSGTGSVHDTEIPDFELGEPEEDVHAQQQLAGSGSRVTRERSLSQNSNRSDKHVDVIVDEEEEGTGHGEELLTTEEAKEKHRKFEQLRKRHYEMKNIKDLLACVFFIPLLFQSRLI
jgi:protein phosphatase inhibitor 2